MRKIAIILSLALLAFAGRTALDAQSMVSIGKGCTTAFYIDEDCDGYGPGVRSSGIYGYRTLGVGNKPDADDSDAKINTHASLLPIYDANGNGTLDNSELKKFLLERKGITADNIYYISLTGNNSTGAPDNPNRPYASYNGNLYTSHGAGDVIIFNGGTYVDPNMGGGAPALKSGSAGKPIVIMSMPGEVVAFQTNSAYTFDTSYSAWSIIDGFTIDNPTNTGLGTGWSCSSAQNTIIRNIETQKFSYVSCIEGHDNLTVERSIFHHQREHGFYMGANTNESSNIIVRDNIFYSNGWDPDDGDLGTSYGGLQFNGRCTNCVFERNIAHTNSGWGFSLIQGVANSTIRNNLIFNNGTYGIIMQVYPGSCKITGSGPDDICPYDTNNNLFINNTIWVGRNRGDGNYGSGTFPEPFAGIGIARNTSQCVENGVSVPSINCTMEQTFRNNIIVSRNGASFIFFMEKKSWNDKWMEDSTFDRNVLYKADGNTNIGCLGDWTTGGCGTAFTFAQFEAAFGGTNSSGNPLFTRAEHSEFSTPAFFNFRLLAGSPARGFGSATGAPPVDLTQSARRSPPDAGAYEFTGAGPTRPAAPTNLRIIR